MSVKGVAEPIAGAQAAGDIEAEALPLISPFLQAVTPFVRALARGDVQGMLEAAAPMEAEGYAWLAYRAWWEAAWLLAEAGRAKRPQRAKVEDLVLRLEGFAQGTPGPPPRPMQTWQTPYGKMLTCKLPLTVPGEW